jgi:hypothetical protein
MSLINQQNGQGYVKIAIAVITGYVISYFGLSKPDYFKATRNNGNAIYFKCIGWRFFEYEPRMLSVIYRPLIKLDCNFLYRRWPLIKDFDDTIMEIR